jgi:pimeloyl-ACP methyl ester carboxylesterase
MFEFLARNWALISIFGTLVVLVGVPALILCKYVRIIVNIFRDVNVPLAMDTRSPDCAGAECAEFRAFDGARLYGMFIPPAGDQPVRGTVIFAHELNSDMTSAMRYCAGLLAAGYEVFSFDFRGQGSSPAGTGYKSRLWPSDRDQADVLGAIAFVEDRLERSGRPREIGLVGVSRGAGAAILGAVGVPAVRAIMIDGGFSTDAYLEYLMQRWVSIFAKVRLVYENHHPLFWRFLRWLSIRSAGRKLGCRFPSVRKAVPRLGKIPMMIVHGERDGHIPVAQARLLHDLAQGPKYLWVCPGAKHNQAVMVEPQRYGEYSVRFFDEHLAGLERSQPLDGGGLLSQLAQPIAEPARVAYADYTRPARAGKR